MKRVILPSICLLAATLGVSVSVAERTPAVLTLTGDWQVRVTVPGPGDGKERTATLDVSPPAHVTVVAEKYDRLPAFNASAPGYAKGVPLHGLVAQCCSGKGLLDPTSVQVHDGPKPEAGRFEPDKDFGIDLDWATFGRLPHGRIGENQPVYVDYRHDLSRLDSVVLTPGGSIELRQGKPDVATPLPPKLAAGECRLANVWVPGRIAKLGPQHLFPKSQT